MSIESIISHVGAPNIAREVLNEDTRMRKELKKLALEFCHAFNVKVTHDALKDQSIRRHFLRVVTPSGVPCGWLTANEDRSGVYYQYSSPHIQKQKASARSNKNQRDSEKISSLIQSIKRNGEAPNEQALFKSQAYGIVCGFRSIQSNGSKDPIVLNDRAALTELVKHFLGHANAAEGYRDVITSAYEAYVNNMSNYNDRSLTLRRYMEGGVTAIASFTANESLPIYIVADVTPVDIDKYHFTTQNIKAYNDLSEVPDLQALAMMTRTYFSGRHTTAHNGNVFGLPLGDTYHPEMDVSTGYASGDVLWILVPKKPA